MIVALLVITATHLGIELFLFFRSKAWICSDDKTTRDAAMCVLAAEQFRGDGKGEEKARVATQTLLDLHPRMKPSVARMLVEHAVGEMNSKTKE